MIVAPQQNDKSETASIASTLVDVEKPPPNRIPRYLAKLIGASLPLALVAFICTVIDNVIRSQNPKLLIPIILAFVLTLPHHGETLLLVWLQRHHTGSILPFTPCSPKVIAYATFLWLLWMASVVERAISFHRARKHDIVLCFPGIGSNGTPINACSTWMADILWAVTTSAVASAIEAAIILSITTVCFLHHRRELKSSPALTRSNPSMLEGKAAEV